MKLFGCKIDIIAKNRIGIFRMDDSRWMTGQFQVSCASWYVYTEKITCLNLSNMDVLVGHSTQNVHHRGSWVMLLITVGHLNGHKVTDTGEDIPLLVGVHGFNPIHSFSRYD